ncbi:MAG TPA: DUF2254 family protein [Chthoniobacterales bacterium]|nr:DUF2254 family protein [Chthoniobacterales bacterium]
MINQENPGRQATALHRLSNAFEAVRRSFAEFLAIPTGIIAAFLLLALGSYFLDAAQVGWLQPGRNFLKRHVFADPKATSDLLGAIAAGIITMTSVTISLLLVAVQQAAAALTGAVYDQFLRRYQNQVYFGFFVGLALYSLITLATVNAPFNPIFGGTIAFLGTVVALYLLILLLYTTINQMRPVEIIEAIHDHVLLARVRQEKFLAQTRRESRVAAPSRACVRAERDGFVTGINLQKLGAALAAAPNETEIELLVAIGSHLAFQDPVAEIKTPAAESVAGIEKAIRQSISLKQQRDLSIDPAYGIHQLEMIGWTTISTAKSNPAPGLLAIYSLRDIYARWVVRQNEAALETAPVRIVPVVYHDNTPAHLLNAFETLAVVASESMQHQSYIAVLDTFAAMLGRLPNEEQKEVEDRIRRLLPALGDFVLTSGLEAALCGLISALENSGSGGATATAVRAARDELAQTIGKLRSRGTRAS